MISDSSKHCSSKKDSGVEWIGLLPNAWSIRSIKSLFQIKKEIAGTLGYDVLSVTQRGIKKKDISSNEGQLSNDYSKYQLVSSGDFIMNHMDLLTGSVDISEYDGVTSPDYRVFKERCDEINPKYALYIFQLAYSEKIFYGMGQGVSTLGRWRLPREQFYNFKIPFPTKQEQLLISNHLEKQQTVIDSIIDLSIKTIDRLHELRESIITNAVTKGLNPNVDFKESNIDWIGQIPCDWQRGSLIRFLRSPLTDGPHETPTYVESGVPFISIDSLNDTKNVDLSNVRSFISEEDYLEYSKKTILEKGDILFTKSATIGKTAIVGDERYMIWSPLTIIKPNPSLIDRLFLYYVLNSKMYIDYVTRLGGFNTQANVGMRSIEKSIIPYPPLAIQIAIGKYLDSQCELINEHIEATLHCIEKLKELKQSVNYEYVTGKKELFQ
jgi:type I restriction enzyme S subunit